jgi:hypothetical protein
LFKSFNESTMKPPVTTQPLITVAISQLVGKSIEGLTAQVTNPRFFPEEEPRWRKLIAVKRKRDYKKWWIILYYTVEEPGDHGYTGAVEGAAADNIKIQFTAEVFAKIQPHIKA